MSTRREPTKSPRSVADQLLDGASALLASKGPEALKARAIAAASGMSSMVVYSHFGGVPELLGALATRGFDDLVAAFAKVPITDDPVFDLFSLALTSRAQAHRNPHLYDLMFGLSVRSSYRPGARLMRRSSAFRAAYSHMSAACVRLVQSKRVTAGAPGPLAAQLWSYVHGFVSLELAGHFREFDDPVTEVMLPLGVTFCVGLGDRVEAARASHVAALARFAEKPARRAKRAPSARRH